MESLVSIIKSVEKNIAELKEMQKKNSRDLASILQEKENIASNLAMFEKVLEDLNRTKNKEIQIIMNDEVVNTTDKRGGIRTPLHLNAIDEKKEIIASYNSTVEAAKDLGISTSNVSYRVIKVSVEKQIKDHGYALIRV